MGRPLYTNNAATYLAFGITNTATTMQVSANAGSLFPSPTNGDYFYISLISLSGPIIEIVQCTQRVGDVFTIVRGQEGTSPQNWNMGDNVQLRITAAGMNFLTGASAVTTEEQVFTATQGQTVFALTNFDYTPNTNSLAVFINGSKQVTGVNYSETSINVVTLSSGANAGDVVEIVAGLGVANGTIYATDIKYNEGQTGAVTRTVEAKLQESVSVKDFGAVGDGTTDDTNAIQAAVTASVGKTLYFPSGTYIVNATQLITVQTDANHSSPAHCCCILPAGGNISFLGIKGESIIKAKNNITTGAPNNYWNMFMSNTVDNNITFDGITFDLNGQNNPVITNNTSVHQAALMWSGATACPSNLIIRNCIFQNGAGISTIVLSFSITGSNPSGSNFLMKDTSFINNGFGSNDHSSVFCTSGNSLIDNCIFTIPTQPIIVQTAVEIHAAYSTMTNCIVANYPNGMIVAAGDTGPADTHSVSVNYNKFQCSFSGVNFYRSSSASGSGLWNIDVSENSFEMLDQAPSSIYASSIASCIYAVPSYYMYDIYIRNNTMVKGTYVYQMNGIYLGNSQPGASNTNIVISDNYIDGFTNGITMAGTLGTGSTGNLYINDNKIINSKTSTTPSVAGTGVNIGCYSTQSIGAVYFENNKILNSQYAGVGVAGTIGTWRYWNNVVDAGTAFGYSNVATITNKSSFYDYIEGTFTPNQGSGLSVVGTFSSVASYTKVGRVVTINGSVAGSTSVAVSTTGAICSNLPFPVVVPYAMGSSTNATLTATGSVQAENSTLYSCTSIGASGTIYFSITYFTTAE